MRRAFASSSRLVFAIGFVASAALVTACSGERGAPVAPIIGAYSPPPSGAPTATPTGHASATPVPTATPTATARPSATPISTATPTASPTPGTQCTNSATKTIGTAGGTIGTPAVAGTFNETFPSGAFASATSVTLCYIPQADLPAPLVRFSHVDRNGRRFPQFTAGAGNTYVLAFSTTFSGATLNGSASLTGAGVVPGSIAAGTVLNLAINENSTWVDVGTALVGAGGSFQTTIPNASLPDITQAGKYLLYLPASGNTTQVNLGFALIADDSTADTNGLQFVQIEDSNGNALPTPTTTYFPIANAGDLDGESLTPDAQHGATVDGENLVYFFSGIPQHQFVLSPTTVDITAYGADGDSIVSLPDGDEDIATGDDGGPLVVISGILSGAPVVADTIASGPANNPNYRDGLVISNDGTVLLSRGSIGGGSDGVAGIDVFKIAPSAAHAGSTGTGTVDHTFTLETTLTSVPTPFFEDGRDEMAISPVDSSRAVVAGYSGSFDAEIALLTGLPTNATVTALQRLRSVPGMQRRRSIPSGFEPSSHRKPLSATFPANTEITAVEISPNGKFVYLNTNVGIYAYSGVNTGSLTQVGAVYAPTITVPGGTCSWATTFEGSASLGITPDGKYLIADPNCELSFDGTDQHGSGVLLTVPINADGSLGAAVGQLNYVVSPFNDQIIVH